MTSDDDVPVYSRRDIASLVSVDDLRDLLIPLSGRGERLSRSYASTVAGRRGFPAPLINHPHLQLWLRREVDDWIAAERRRRGG